MKIGIYSLLNYEYDEKTGMQTCISWEGDVIDCLRKIRNGEIDLSRISDEKPPHKFIVNWEPDFPECEYFDATIAIYDWYAE